jgi:two-component system sensor histidine kinase/response regulator
VNLMGGEIGVESKPGEGATFWFTAEFERQQSKAARKAQTITSLVGLRALIVDDNEVNRRIIEHYVSSWGMTGISVDSGPAALDLLRRENFDLALLDYHMPAMDGVELARRIRSPEARPDLKLFLLTSLHETSVYRKHKNELFAGCLTKPIPKTQLHRLVSTVMADHAGTVNAPLRTESPRVPAVEPSLEPAASLVPYVGHPTRILLAEDNPVNQRLAVLQLRKLGYRVDVVANGREAVQAVQSMPYDIVLMDCQMPEMDGFEATQAIRLQKGPRNPVVIAMTASALESDRLRCQTAGMDDYISKPVQVSALAEILTKWAARTHSVKEQVAG